MKREMLSVVPKAIQAAVSVEPSNCMHTRDCTVILNRTEYVRTASKFKSACVKRHIE